MTSRHSSSWLSAFLWLALLVALWAIIAPIQLGGRAAFVIVNGNSMEPLYHRGDLVLTQAASDYQVGDIVTYRHPQIGPVIHRIIGRDGERWIFQGDNNTFVDSYRPAQPELIGRSWLHLPGVGKVLVWLRAPLAMALLALVIGAIFVHTTLNSGAPRKRGSRTRGLQRAGRAGGYREGLLTVLAALALACAVLAGFAFTRPLVRDVSEDLPYLHSGEFRYSAAAPPGLYDTPGVRSGEPVFRHLADSMTVEFAYTLQADGAADLQGTGRLVAQLSALNGWKRTIELQPEQAVHTGATMLRGVLDLALVQELIDNLERQTGLEHQQYVLTFAPEIDVVGTLDGQALRDEFAPRLEFQVDQWQLQLLKDGTGEQDVLKPLKSGILKRVRSEPNTLALLGLTLAVADARAIGLIGLSLALAGMCAAGLPLLRAMRCDEAARIKLQYGSLIVEAAPGDLLAGECVVELATIGDLAKLAEKHSAMILHQVNGLQHRYLVRDTAGTYGYQIGGRAAPAEKLPTRERNRPTAALRTLEPFSVPTAPIAHWQADFLAALREYGRVPDACRAVGISVASAYLEREREPAFALAWSNVQASTQRRYGVKTV